MIDAVSPLTSSTRGPAAVDGIGTAARLGTVSTNAEAGADFGAMVSQLASQAAGVVRNAEAVSVAGIQGSATVQQVVEAVMSAEQTLQGAVAIRDKVVASYLELSRMQI
jgi:flagellar hook-basal body complex protein FliE